jgi:hypothetical protein
MKLKIALMIMTTIMTNKLMAENVRFENIRVGGTGCKMESTSIVYAPDQSSASLIFENFQSHVPVEVNSPKQVRTISQLPCNVFVEVKVPVGQKLDSLQVSYDMRGNASLDRGVQGYFRSYLMNTAGLGTERGRGRSPELVQEKNWVNTTVDQYEDFVLSTVKSLAFSSDCRGNGGQDRVVLHLQHHILTQIMRGYENTNAEGTIMVDTSDITGGLKLKAVTSSCSTGGGGNSTPGRTCRQVVIAGRVQQICR